MIEYVLSTYAGVAELADAADSKSAGSNIVWVQVPPPAPMEKARCKISSGFLFMNIIIC